MKLITTQKPIVFCVFDVYWLQRCLLLQKPIDKAHSNPQRLSLVCCCCCFFLCDLCARMLFISKSRRKNSEQYSFFITYICMSMYILDSWQRWLLCTMHHHWHSLYSANPMQCDALPCIYESLVLHHVFVKRQRKSQ